MNTLRAFGEVLAQQSISVLVGASLPGAVGVAEVHLHAGVARELLVLSHLPAPVVGEALTHRAGNGVELVAEGLQHMRSCRRVGVGQLDQHHQARGALNQRANGARIAFALDEISLPMPGQLAIFNLGRAHMDAQQIGDLSTPILAFGARPALSAGHA